MADGLLNKASIILTPTGYKAGTLYNVAPVVEPYEDFDFARASVASRVNSSGLVEMVGRTLGSELVTNGDFATDSDWTFSNIGGSNGWRIADGRAICDTSAATKNRNLTSSLSLDGSKDYKLTIDILQSADNITIYVGATALSPKLPTGENLGYEYYISSSDHSGGALMFYAGSSDLQEIDNVSVKEIIDTNNIPRINYDSNGDNGHILLEPTSTNLIPYSEDFSQSIYIKDSTVSVGTINNVSPSGESNATKIDVTASGRIYANFTTDTYVSSIFIKAGTFAYFKLAGVQVDLVAVTNANGTIESLGNGWFRVSINYTGNRPFQIQAYPDGSYATHTTSGNYFIWGAQLETLSHPTSYIPTLTGSTETRATETATGAGSADLINSTEGVLYAEIAALDDSSISIGMCDGSTDNRVLILLQSNNTIRGFVESSDTIVFDEIYQVSSTLDYHKIAIKYKANDFALWIDGVERDTDTNGAIPIGLNELLFNNGGGGSAFYGKCKALAVFNEALSDDELNNLTG
jgi:hypothetical protein